MGAWVSSSDTSEQFKQTSACEDWRNESSYLSSFVHNSGFLAGVRGGGTESGAARTRETTGCGRWCGAGASGSSRQRRRPLRTAASRWCPPRPPARTPPPPPLGPPSRRCREGDSLLTTCLGCCFSSPFPSIKKCFYICYIPPNWSWFVREAFKCKWDVNTREPLKLASPNCGIMGSSISWEVS